MNPSATRTLLAATLLLSGCLSAELDAREVGVTVADQSFPPMLLLGNTFCGFSTSCTTTDFVFDVGGATGVLDQDGVRYDLTLTALTIAESATSVDLSSIVAGRVVLLPGDGSAPVVLATYARPARSGRLTVLRAEPVPGIDLEPYVQGGAIHLQARLAYDAPTAGFTGTVDGTFHLKAKIDYARSIGL